MATGTGIWLKELAKKHPETCQFNGFDITDAQFPAPNALPNNIKFQVADLFKPLPSELHGKYDVVHIRYLNVAMTPKDWEPVTRNVTAMLKPGGWLQWTEGDFSQCLHWVRLDPLRESNGGWEKFRECIGTDRTDNWGYFARHLNDIFKQVGLTNVVQQTVSTDRIPETRLPWTACAMYPLGNLLRHEEAAKEGGLSPKECEEVVKKIEDEYKSGMAYLRFDIHTFLGQKAL